MCDYSNDWEYAPHFPNYKVYEDGRVQNKRTERFLKACDNNSGYQTVNLYNNGSRETKLVHRLVAETFIEGYFNGAEVNHKDGNKHNNHKNNLEYCTRGENESHAYRTKLKRGPKHIPVRVVESGEVFGSIRECARAIDGDDTNIGRCLRGTMESYRGLTFEYANESEINSDENKITKSIEFKSKKPTRRSVKIIETGEVFSSISECARAVNGDIPGICGCLSGRHNTHRGYHYEYVD